mmetsp:Transcript_5098/g.11334  ORF Transcript_5098/g.11334 Transcript_5098/m.11334 type:complete len:274 (-) Transcript_5098:714-1535(-)
MRRGSGCTGSLLRCESEAEVAAKNRRPGSAKMESWSSATCGRRMKLYCWWSASAWKQGREMLGAPDSGDRFFKAGSSAADEVKELSPKSAAWLVTGSSTMSLLSKSQLPLDPVLTHSCASAAASNWRPDLTSYLPPSFVPHPSSDSPDPLRRFPARARAAMKVGDACTASIWPAFSCCSAALRPAPKMWNRGCRRPSTPASTSPADTPILQCSSRPVSSRHAATTAIMSRAARRTRSHAIPVVAAAAAAAESLQPPVQSGCGDDTRGMKPAAT